jgi:NTE family protein
VLDFLKIDTLMAGTAPVKDELKRAVEAALKARAAA